MFYLLAAVVLLLGAALVVLALRPRGHTSTGGAGSRRRTVAALFEDRLDELRGELARGGVDAADREALEAELGAALLADVPEADAQQPGVTGGSWNLRLLVASVAMLVLGAGLVYALVGDPVALRLAGAEAILKLDSKADRDVLEDWRVVLSERIEDRPGDSRSAYLLGHVDLKLGYYGTAAEAFALAHQATGDDPSVDVLWLQARYMAAGGRLDDASREIAERILAWNPNQPLVLEVYAIDAFHRGEFRESVSLLNRALSSPGLAASHRAALANGFEEARSRLGDLLPALDVAVEAAAGPPPGSTLFVIARPIGGGMPFAVVRRPAAVLPTTIRLDDAVSMNPAAPLSSASAVEVVVRLSRAGTAMAHPGDWEWASGVIELDAQSGPVALSARLLPPGTAARD